MQKYIKNILINMLQTKSHGNHEDYLLPLGVPVTCRYMEKIYWACVCGKSRGTCRMLTVQQRIL